MHLLVRELGAPAHRRPGEIVERKGLGHPDTICDAIAEQVSLHLCRHYLDRFGAILHHNVDKVLLCGGAARPAFGGGEIVRPIEIILAGRATHAWRGVTVPVHDLAIAACRGWLAANLPLLDLDRHVAITCRIHPGSSDLTRLFARAGETPLANDTSCGAGFAPPTNLERVVFAVEQELNGAEVKAAHPAIGTDIKVLGVRRGDRIELTVGCAFVDRHLSDLAAYVDAKRAARELVLAAAHRVTALEVDAVIDAADDEAAGDLFLTVTGTSAEAGDDGEVGRGNRVGGLITPCRPMTLEAAAGKNPVSHVGKLYNVIAHRVAASLADAVPEIQAVDCLVVSQIGSRIDDPQLVDVGVDLNSGAPAASVRAIAADVVRSQLARFDDLRRELLDGRVRLF